MLTIEELRTRIGLVSTDVSKDAQLTECYSLALAIVEQYLDRSLIKATYTETFFETRSALLKAWPVDSVTTVDGNAPDTNLSVDKERGIIRNVCWNNVEVKYIGGYQAANVPLPIVLAINGVFDALWFSTPGYGLVKGAAIGTGEVKRLTVDGVTIEYFQPTTTGTATVTSASNSFIPVPMQSILERYKRESLLGVG